MLPTGHHTLFRLHLQGHCTTNSNFCSKLHYVGIVVHPSEVFTVQLGNL